jgi:hypothetical protein
MFVLDHHMHVVWIYYLCQFGLPSPGHNRVMKEPHHRFME